MKTMYIFGVILTLCVPLYGQDIAWQTEYQAMLNGEMSPAYSGGFGFAKPVFVDIDNDGDLDLFIGYHEDNGVAFILNDGNATTPAWVMITRDVFSFLEPYTAPTFCDIDGDGDYDAFVGGWDGEIRYIRNTGTASAPVWTLEPGTFENIDIAEGHSTPTFCDMDADGDFDLFVGDDSGNIHFYRNTGTANAHAFTLENASFAQGNWMSVPSFYDIDNDGDQDLFVGTGWHIYFYRNTGTAAAGTWTLESQEYIGIDTNVYVVPAWGDLDGDGDADLVYGDDEKALVYYQNTGTAAAAAWNKITEDYATIDVRYPCFPTFTDIDADGDFDMFLGRYFNGILGLINAGDANAPDWTYDSETKYLNQKNIPTFCDIDNDGDQDLFLGQGNDGTLEFYENQGTAGVAVWAAKAENYGAIDVGDSYAAPAFCDIDNDGDLDLFVGSGEGDLHYFENTGSANAPTWAASTSDYANATQLNTIRLMPTFHDIDGDGDYDLFVGTYEGSVAFFRNIGNAATANFEFVTYTYADFQFESQTRPAFCDIDNDGDQDFFIGMTGGGLFFFRNMGMTGVEVDMKSLLPDRFVLEQNYPNPFNPKTAISYRLAEHVRVLLTVYDTRGRLVDTLVDAQQTAGPYSVVWDAAERASGLYFYKLEVDGKILVNRAILVK